ncbi:MAG: hypothetical protein HYY36_07570 [Gammaproteobacteria bacterium]|nr:hypothetical protein [Gammaproteobacteria bacterium]
MNVEKFNMELRKFLKKVGITSQREIEEAVRQGMEAGKLKGRESLRAVMRLEIVSIGLDTTIEGTIDLE